MKIVLFAGSLRKDSFNKKILRAIQPVLASKKIDSELMDLGALEIPLYNEDDEKESGLPNGIKILCQKINEANALIISAPEYNGSISGVLKNAMDWVSRDKSNPFQRKLVMLTSASPGYYGGVRGLWHTKVPFDKMEAQIYPEFFSLASAHQAFTPEGTWKDEKMKIQLEKILGNFIQHVQIFQSN